MGLGAVLSQYMGQYITLPAYIGSMIVAAIVRNVGDFSGKYTVEGKGMNAIAEISLVLFVTMAINGLKLHELLNLALPLMIILAGQTILIFRQDLRCCDAVRRRYRFLDGINRQRFGQYAGHCREIRLKPEGMAHH